MRIVVDVDGTAATILTDDGKIVGHYHKIVHNQFKKSDHRVRETWTEHQITWNTDTQVFKDGEAQT